MSTGAAPATRACGPAGRGARRDSQGRGLIRLALLYAASRRVPAALAVITGCAAGLRLALIAHWDTYGALQLPLVFEVAAVTAITVTTSSSIGEPERACGLRLPWLRLTAALALTTVAVAALAAAGTGAHLAGGTLAVLRNVSGLTGLGLLCAAITGGGLAWTSLTGYLLAGAYGLYTQWHGPPLTTPWLWPARPPHDLGAALCAGLVLVLGMAVTTLRGARDSAGEEP